MGMLEHKKYTKVYTAYDKLGNLELILYDDHTGGGLVFDGFDLVYKRSMAIPAGFTVLAAPKAHAPADYEIEAIKCLDDVTFIKFSSEVIFQIHSMSDGGGGGTRQVLSIFEKEKDGRTSTPMGINAYEAALMRMRNGEDCEIEKEE